MGALSKFSLLPQFTCPGGNPSASTTTESSEAVSPIIEADTSATPPNGIINSDGSTQKKSLLLLSGNNTFGRTGNNLIEFLHALQVARDKDLILGIMHGSWAMQVLMGMFLAIDGEGWEERWEDAFCGKF